MRKLAANVQVVTRKELEDAGVRSVEQALSYYVPGNGNVQPGAFSSLGLRGVRSGMSASGVLGDRVLLLIDGLRASTGNPSAVPFALVERMEIVRGPSSVLYGGSAMGGVVNIITRKGRGDMHGEVGASYGRFDHAAGYAGIHGSLSDRWGMALSAGSSRRGDYRAGGGYGYENSHTADSDVGATLTYAEGSAALHMTALHRSVYDTGSPGEVASPTPDDRTGRHYSRFSAQLEYDGDSGCKVHAAVYGDRNRYRTAWGGAWSGDSCYGTDTVGTRLTSSFALGDAGRIALGAEYANMRDKAYGSSVSQPDMRTQVMSIFTEYRWEGESFSSFSGLRYDRYDGSLKSNHGMKTVHGSKDYDHVSWSTGSVWWLTDWLGLKLSAGTAFVAPTAVNLVGDYQSWGVRYRGNPDLDAETSLTAEGGFEIEVNGFRAEVAYFQSWNKDRISVVDASGSFGVKTWRNVDSVRLNGFDISLAWRGDLGGVKLVPYLNSEIFTKAVNGDGSAVTYLPHHSTVTGVGLGWKKLWLDVNARFTGTQKQSAFDYGTYESRIVDMDAYTVLNARMTVHATDSLDLYVGVNNITDRYYTVTLGYPLPGRAVYGGFTYKF
ncbi:MAG: TonB-dependent receptor [Mailhella sp.]|nr:TonB-dependent receptor [Mailhella sp.]